MLSNNRRQLAAIMFTDIVGYTIMMQENERAAAAVRQRHREVFESEHERFEGEILQYYGDGTLSIFKSAVEAVRCAISMQQAFLTGRAVPLRIGIHLGDIVFSENDVYGDGVNLASRVESMGVEGCILISDKINFAIRGQNSISTQSVGFFEFKNVKDSVEVFAITNAGIRIPARSEMKGKLKENKKSIAVLPFTNMSSDPENEYFSDGISEEILNALVKVEGLQVTARTSSFCFKGQNLDIREIGQQLGVGHVLEGSVRKAGNRVRVTAQLVSSVDGFHFFSETYDQTLEDIFHVQDEIAQKVTNRLREHLQEEKHEQNMVNAPTANMEAYETYLRGLYYFKQWGDEPLQKAIPLFHKAIEMQEDFALPHAQLGISYIFQAFQRKISWAEAHKKAIPHIDRVIELDAETPEAYLSIFALNFFLKWDWKAAYETVKKGLQLFPNYASLYHALSALHYLKGDTTGAVNAHRKGLQLNPLSVEMIFYMGIAYFWNKEYDEANFYFSKILKTNPDHRTALEYTGWDATQKNNFGKAISIFQNLEPASGYHLHRLTSLGWVYLKMGEVKKAEICLEDLLVLKDHLENGEVLSFDLATLYASFGEFDLAFHYLENAIRNKIGDSMLIRLISLLSPLYTDSRFAEMEALIGEMPEIDIVV